MRYYLEFEKPIEELELKIEELKLLSDRKDMDITSAVKSSEKGERAAFRDIFQPDPMAENASCKAS